MTTTRREALAATLGLYALVRGEASAQTQPTIRLGIIPSTFAAEAFYGQAKGIFKKHGLDVRIQPMSSGALMASAIAAGSLDIAIADIVTIANAHSHGLPFVYIAPGVVDTPQFPIAALIVKPDSPIVDAKTLNGKTVAVNAVKSSQSVTVQAWCDNNGGDSKTLKFLEVPLPQQVAAVAEGTCDASLAGEPFNTMAAQQGLRNIIMSKGNIAPTYMTSGWFATKEWIGKNREAARSFAAAMIETAAWANANRPASEPIIVKALKLPADLVHNIRLKTYYGERLEPALVQPFIDAALKYQVLAAPMRAEEIIAKL